MVHGGKDSDLVLEPEDRLPDIDWNMRESILHRMKAFFGRSSTFFGFFPVVIVLLLGSGALWSAISAYYSKINTEEILRVELLDIQKEILPSLRYYVEARDEFAKLRSDGRLEYLEGHNYLIAKERLVALIDSYNTVEAKLSISEMRQPLWFRYQDLVPPVAPVNLKVERGDGNRVKLSWEPGVDGVALKVRERLKSLYEAYGQSFCRPTDSTPPCSPVSQ